MALLLKNRSQPFSARRGALRELARRAGPRQDWYATAALADLVAPQLDADLGGEALELLQARAPYAARDARTLRLLLDAEGRLSAGGLEFDLESWPAWVVADLLGFCLHEGGAELRSRAAELARNWLAAGPRGGEAAQSLVPAALSVLNSSAPAARRSAARLLGAFEGEAARLGAEELIGLLAVEQDREVAAALVRWLQGGSAAELELLERVAADRESALLARVLAVEALGGRVRDSVDARLALERLSTAEAPAVRAAARAALAQRSR